MHIGLEQTWRYKHTKWFLVSWVWDQHAHRLRINLKGGPNTQSVFSVYEVMGLWAFMGYNTHTHLKQTWTSKHPKKFPSLLLKLSSTKVVVFFKFIKILSWWLTSELQNYWNCCFLKIHQNPILMIDLWITELLKLLFFKNSSKSYLDDWPLNYRITEEVVYIKFIKILSWWLTSELQNFQILQHASITSQAQSNNNTPFFDIGRPVRTRRG